jgi:hypothetical protein
MIYYRFTRKAEVWPFLSGQPGNLGCDVGNKFAQAGTLVQFVTGIKYNDQLVWKHVKVIEGPWVGYQRVAKLSELKRVSALELLALESE